jgi:hypothetical protein
MPDPQCLSGPVRDLGEDGVTSVTVEVSCLRCGGRLRAVATDEPRGSMVRARRVSLSCVEDRCTWSGVLVSELIEMAIPRARGRAS